MLSRLGHGSKEFIVIRVCAFLLLSYTFYLGTYFLLSDEFNFNFAKQDENILSQNFNFFSINDFASSSSISKILNNLSVFAYSKL